MAIQVLFDRVDRRYRLGEEIAGTVKVDSEPDLAPPEIWVTYRWRTHGRGSRDQGPEQRVGLPGGFPSQPRTEGLQIPFRFPAPNGPTTYRGQFLNIDWYLTAHARRGRGRVLKQEEDFLLLPGPPKGPLAGGNATIAARVLTGGSPVEASHSDGSWGATASGASPPPSESKFMQVLTWLGMAIAILAVAAFHLDLSRFLPGGNAAGWLIVAAVMIALVVLLGVIYRNAYRQKLKIRRVGVEPAVTRPGGLLQCTLDFVVRRDVFLRVIRATLFAQERVVSMQGTSSVTETYMLRVRTHERRFEQQLLEGAGMTFTCSLPVDADAPPSFASPNNHLEWIAKVEVELQGWPGMTKTFPIMVLP